jgi:hypothetical protein
VIPPEKRAGFAPVFCGRFGEKAWESTAEHGD